MTLQEIGNRTNFDYKLVGKAAGKFSVLIRKDKALRALTDRCLIALAKSEMRPFVSQKIIRFELFTYYKPPVLPVVSDSHTPKPADSRTCAGVARLVADLASQWQAA